MNVTDLREYIPHEIEQLHQTGHDVVEVRRRWNNGSGVPDEALRDFYDQVLRICPRDHEHDLNEPSGLAEIKALWSRDHTPVSATPQ